MLGQDGGSKDRSPVTQSPGTQPPVFEKPDKPARVREPEQGSLLGGFLSWALAGRTSAWLTSAALHMGIVLGLSLLFFSLQKKEQIELTVIPSILVEDSVDFLLDANSASSDGLELPSPPERTVGSTDSATTIVVTPPSLEGLEVAAITPLPTAMTIEMTSPLKIKGGGFSGRKLGNRRDAALAGGGTAASEAAVEAGLAWLAAHQWEDGSWRFDLEACPQCGGHCRDSGYFRSSTASTGLALLCFLGAGYTHQDGPYQEVVQRGLYHLSESMSITSHGGDLRDRFMGAAGGRDPGLLAAVDLVRGQGDNMYSHGIAALALTEAYGMTRDVDLKGPAQEAATFIVNAQYDDGGWRYSPGFETPSDGDVTVSGWQVMALKSASLGGLKVPYETWLRLEAFLDAMQREDGQYLYKRGGKPTGSNTAIGLLCRMVGGWPLTQAHLRKGVAKLGTERPDRNHMYFNYYSTLVQHHAGGAGWQRWNPRMREYLVKSQATEGHERGSWYFAEPHSAQGGRLYTTAMAIMTLEVYYRYMPLYREVALERE
ncbi:hypothetical protein HG15A2_13910 [Adhaeretor mobilis]|uniref:Squalene cyclase C-terminal domain-containing protein n=2 Tax=Adhaeretor mobilis TaxID=1930276 RepID=A0A517MTB3_9BACT|nr:hypothetical protein HG15A2_13910 [Adhaeretor mobilis]